jgi:hypothetical protein
MCCSFYNTCWSDVKNQTDTGDTARSTAAEHKTGFADSPIAADQPIGFRTMSALATTWSHVVPDANSIGFSAPLC